jgi:2-keto-4-pentenoate hydratase/2-oxohepta-3-ene-1,7-dioic acid hydratase in catechol pathway
MKLARFAVDGKTAIGVVDAEKGTVQALATHADDMVRIVEAHAQPAQTLKTAGPIRALAEVAILAPLHAPRRNIICVGKNYREHAVEFARSGFEAGAVAGAEVDAYPAVFSKPASTICAASGELRQNANTRDLLFDSPTLIATISSGLTLEPGDIIATGTPVGVGIGMKPPVFLKADDVVTIEITGLGRLHNRFF